MWEAYKHIATLLAPVGSILAIIVLGKIVWDDMKRGRKP